MLSNLLLVIALLFALFGIVFITLGNLMGTILFVPTIIFVNLSNHFLIYKGENKK